MKKTGSDLRPSMEYAIIRPAGAQVANRMEGV